MAGGSTIHRFNAGEYNTTIYAKQGDLGSQVRLLYTGLCGEGEGAFLWWEKRL